MIIFEIMNPTAPKTFEVPGKCRLTEEMVLEFVEIVEGIEMRTFRRNLRMLTFYFLNREHQELSAEFQVFMQQLPAFLDFLEVVEDALLQEQTA